MAKVLLVDDEDKFRETLAARLRKRGYEVIDVDDGEAAIKVARSDEAVEVAILDLRMPIMDGIQTLKELKVFRPALQAIMLTGHGSLESARDAGHLDAFKYLQKPCDLDELVAAIEEARAEANYAKARHEIPTAVEKGPLLGRLMGSHNSRPLFIALGVAVFAGIVLMPAPDRLVELLSAEKATPESNAERPDEILGYASYSKMAVGETISHYYSKKNGMARETVDADGRTVERELGPKEAAFRAKVMLAIIVLAALFWATGAVPVGVTAMTVGVAMYFFDVLKPDDIAQAFAKDAVIFIFGVLALAKAISKTGLDRRIGLLLLAPAKNLALVFLVFLPLFSMTCGFISEHAMVAFTMPLFVMVYASATREMGVKKDRRLMVMFALAICYAANSGGPGSPAAGGRNAIMIGILGDYGTAPSFAQWVQYGLPFVPIMSLVVGLYFLIFVRRKVRVEKLDVSAVVRRASSKIGPMNRKEYITAAVLLLVVVLWIACSDTLGMGGPVILGLVLLNVFRVLTWKDVAGIHWEVVFLYGSACAIGKGLAVTGGALYMADGFLAVVPEVLKTGAGLAVASSLFTGLVTNFMSDGATVAAIGPITVPMASIAGAHPWMVGLSTAFASSFAHMLIIGTPSNALAYAMAKDPNTGEQLVTLGDFFKHGAVIVLLSFAVLWGWVVLGYWMWVGFPPT